MHPAPLPLLAAGLHPGDYAVIFGYFAAMIFMGFWFSRRQKSSDDYFVGGRSMPWLAVGLSLFSALLSTISYLAVPGETIHQGFAYCLGLLHIPFSYSFIYFILLPFFMRLKVVSAYEYLEWRYGPSVRKLGAGMFMFYVLGWMATVVYTCSSGLAQMTGWPLWVILVTNGLVSTLYATVGGIRAVIWTDVVQALLMLGGGIVTILFVGYATTTTPADWFRDARGIGHMDFPWVSFDPRVRSSVLWIVLNGFAWMVCTHGSNQVALQRYFTMSSPREARRMLFIKMAAEVIMTLLLVVIGFALLSYYLRQPDLLPPEISLTKKQDADKIFPQFIAHQLPPFLVGGILAALFSAAMSTISSGVNSMAAVFTVDFYRSGHKDTVTSGKEYQAGFLFTALSGIAITAIAWGLSLLPGQNNFIDLMQKAFNFLIGPLGGLFFIGMFFPRCRTKSAFVGTATGVAVGLLLAYSDQILGTPVSPFWVIACAALSSVFAGFCAGFTESPRPAGSPPPLTWHAVVRENRI